MMTFLNKKAVTRLLAALLIMTVFTLRVNAASAADVPAAAPSAAPSAASAMPPAISPPSISAPTGAVGAPVTPEKTVAADATAEDEPVTKQSKSIMVFGDSLTAGLGLPADQAFPAQLEARLKQANLNVRVINAGVSGDTTAGGLRRLNYALKQKPDYIILELGANDMLRAVDPVSTRENLRQMLEILKSYNRPVLLAGMRAFPNMGATFEIAYARMYKDLAAAYGAVYYPFFLDGVAGNPELNQADGVHPTAAGVAIVVEKILPAVADMLVAKSLGVPPSAASSSSPVSNPKTK